MNDLRAEFVDKQPGTIALAPSLVKMPTPLIRDGILIKPFRGTTPGLSNPDRSFTKSSEQLCKSLLDPNLATSAAQTSR